MWVRAKNMIERLPKWFREDLLAASFNDEIEGVKLSTYYDMLCSYPIQPIQVWKETNSTDCGLTVDSNNLYGRFMSFKEFPLKEITFYDEDDNVLLNETYRIYDEVIYKMLSIDETALDKFYVGVQYHGIEGEILVGFPQETDPDEDKYKINESLDEVGLTYGLTRRKYKDTLIPYEYLNPTEFVETKENMANFVSYYSFGRAGTFTQLKTYDSEEKPNDYYDGSMKFGIRSEPTPGTYLYPCISPSKLPLNIEEGEEYYGFAWVKGDFEEVSQIYLRIRWMDENNNHISSSPGTTVEITGDWQLLSCSGTAPVGAKKAHVAPTTYNATHKNGDTMWVTHFALTDDLEGALRKTYPPFYPYDIEQDFYFEQRILNEYFSRGEESYSVDIEDSDENVLATISAKDFGARFVSLSWNPDGPDEQPELLTENQATAETNTDGFFVYSPNDRITMALDPIEYYEGSNSVKATVSDTDDIFEFGLDEIPCTENHYYRGAVRIKGMEECTLKLEFFDDLDTSLLEISGDPIDIQGLWYPEDGDWFELSLEGLAPEGAEYAKLYIEFNALSGDSFWLDSCSFKEISPFVLSVTSYETNRDIIEEKFSSYNVESLVTNINCDSQIIKAELVEEGDPEYGYGFICEWGVFNQFGGVRSEIYQHLGIIPDIKPITDYLLIWEEDKWGLGKVWGGDDYMPPNYKVRIPINEIPKNFIHLTMDELQIIVDKYKQAGAKVTPEYWFETEVEANTSLDCAINIGVEFDVSSTANVAVANGVFDILAEAMIDLTILEEQNRNITSTASVIMEAAYLHETLSQDEKVDFDINTTKTTMEYANVITENTNAVTDTFTEISADWTVSDGNGSVIQTTGYVIDSTGEYTTGEDQIRLRTSSSAPSVWNDDTAVLIYRNKSAASSWRASAKISVQTNTNGVFGGIMLYTDRNNAYLFGDMRDTTYHDGITLEKVISGSYTHSVALLDNTTYERFPYYVQIRYDGTNYHFEWSTDEESWISVYSVAAASLGFTPTKVGLFLKSSYDYSRSLYVDEFKVDETLTVEEVLTPEQTNYITYTGASSGSTATREGGTYVHWNNAYRIAAADYASCGGYSSVKSTHYLVGTFDFTDLLPDGAEVTGLSLKVSSHVPTASSQNMGIEVGTRGFSGQPSAYSLSGVGAWTEATFQNSTYQGIWNYDFPMTTDEIKTLFKGYFYVNSIPAGGWARCDWMRAYVWYRYRGASFVTSTQAALDVSPNTGQWGTIEGELYDETSGQTLTCNIRKQVTQTSITDAPNEINFGTVANSRVAQSFTSGYSELSEFQIKCASTAQTSPAPVAQNITWRISADSSGSPGSTITSGTIPSSLFIDDAIVKIPVDLGELDVGSLYWFQVQVSNPDNSKYFKLLCNNSNPSYINLTKVYSSSTATWNSYNGGLTDLWITIKRPVNLLTNQELPLNLNDTEYSDIQAKLTIGTDTINDLPKLKGVKLNRKEVL